MKPAKGQLPYVQNAYILLLLWGWLGFINNFFFGYIPGVMATGYWYGMVQEIMQLMLPIIGIGYSLFYLLRYVKGHLDETIRLLILIWAGLLVSMVLVNLIIQNVNGMVSFELQHPIFMTLIALAITLTGQVTRQRLVILGGVAFACLALASSFLDLSQQQMLEAIGWLVAFVLPGHWIQFKSLKTTLD